MRFAHPPFLLIALALSPHSAPAQAAPATAVPATAVPATAVPATAVPTPVMQALQARDKTLSHLTFTWQRATKDRIFQTLSPAQMAAMRHQIERDGPAEYRRQGMTDEARIKRDVQIEVDNAMTDFGGGSVAYTNVWSFQRDGPQLLASGTFQQSNGFSGTFRQFYEGDAALSVCDYAHFSAGDVTMPLQHAVACKTRGDSLYFVSQSAQLDLEPEHLALLLGTNPLLLRGVTWQVQSQTPTALTLKSHFAAGYTGKSIQMTLAAKNGYVPTEIVVRSSGRTERWTAAHLRLYEGVWVSDKVTYFENVPRSSFTAQTWTLQTLAPSVPIAFSIPATQPVWDYRLVGADLSERTFSHIGMQRDLNAAKVRRYAWPGHFLPEVELTKMFETGQGKVF